VACLHLTCIAYTTTSADGNLSGDTYHTKGNFPVFFGVVNCIWSVDGASSALSRFLCPFWKVSPSILSSPENHSLPPSTIPFPNESILGSDTQFAVKMDKGLRLIQFMTLGSIFMHLPLF